jgi:hypothetical protein
VLNEHEPGTFPPQAGQQPAIGQVVIHDDDLRIEPFGSERQRRRAVPRQRRHYELLH